MGTAVLLVCVCTDVVIARLEVHRKESLFFLIVACWCVGDIIVRVSGHELVGVKEADMVMGWLSGPEGSTVQLEVQGRDGVIRQVHTIFVWPYELKLSVSWD